MKNKYKACSPEETISRISSILHEIGLITRDSHTDNGLFYSCRVDIANFGLESFKIGSNGKGRSFLYSMASGYAELMERLQNRILLRDRIYATKNYIGQLKPSSTYVKKLKSQDLVLDGKTVKLPLKNGGRCPPKVAVQKELKVVVRIRV